MEDIDKQWVLELREMTFLFILNLPAHMVVDLRSNSWTLTRLRDSYTHTELRIFLNWFSLLHRVVLVNTHKVAYIEKWRWCQRSKNVYLHEHAYTIRDSVPLDYDVHECVVYKHAYVVIMVEDCRADLHCGIEIDSWLSYIRVALFDEL